MRARVTCVVACMRVRGEDSAPSSGIASSMALIWLPVATVAVARPPIPWIVASDWDDTIKAGGHGHSHDGSDGQAGGHKHKHSHD